MVYMDGTYIYKWNIYTNGISFSYEKEGKPAVCTNMDGSWEHYAKWDKSRLIPTNLTYVQNLLNFSSEKQNRMVVARSWEVEEMRKCWPKVTNSEL